MAKTIKKGFTANPQPNQSSGAKGYHMKLVRPAEEDKRVFAENLDWLLKITGLNRKEASEELGVDYRVVRRLATAGVSRPDKRNMDTLNKLKDYFNLNSVMELWLDDLGKELLRDKIGNKFVKKFRKQLTAYQSVRSETSFDESAYIAMALGLKTDSSSNDALRKVKFILTTSIGSRFEAVVADYYRLAKFSDVG